VFRAIHDYASESGILISTLPMTLYIWITTNQDTCKAITGQVRLEFSGFSRDENCPITESKLLAILTLIDKVTPIYRIIIEGHPIRAFIVSATEEYMNRGCV